MIPALCAVLLLVIAMLGGSYYCFKSVFSVEKSRLPEPHRMPDGDQYDACATLSHKLIDVALGLPFEPVEIRAWDGKKLFGRIYQGQAGSPVQILFHGYRSNAFRDFCGGLCLALDAGCTAILVDQRAHGQSDGRFLSFGILERRDCSDWVRYAAERFGADTPIILSGISMGAATVVMASELELPGNVVGVMADSGYSGPKAIICKVLADMRYPVKLVYPLIRLGGRIFGGFDVESASSLEAAAKTKLPLLLIHGEDDRFVPCSMSREVAKAGNAELLTVPGAGHGLSYMVNNEAYLRAYADFLKKLKVPPLC